MDAFKRRLYAFWLRMSKFILPFLSCVLVAFSCVLCVSVLPVNAATSVSPPITALIDSLSCVCESGREFSGDDIGDVSLGVYGGLMSSEEIVLTSVTVSDASSSDEDKYVIVYRVRGVSLTGPVTAVIYIPYASPARGCYYNVGYYKSGMRGPLTLDCESVSLTSDGSVFYGIATSELGPRPSYATYDYISQDFLRFELPLDASSEYQIILTLKCPVGSSFDFADFLVNAPLQVMLDGIYTLPWVAFLINLFAAFAIFCIFIKFMR